MSLSKNSADNYCNNLENFMNKLLENNNLGFVKKHKIPVYRLAEWLENNNICAVNDNMQAVFRYDKIVIPKNKNELLKIISDPIPMLKTGVSYVTVAAKTIVLPLVIIIIKYGAKIYKNAETARERAIALYPRESIHGGRGDAFRHALWLALNTQDVGTVIARTVGDAYEMGTDLSNFIQADVHMDIHNNEVGIEIGRDNRRMNLRGITELIQTQIETEGNLLMMRRNNGARGVNAFHNMLFKTTDVNFETVIGFQNTFIKRRDAAQKIVNRITRNAPDEPVGEVRIIDINEIII